MKFTSENTGVNLPWLNKHDGYQSTNWLNVDYDSTKIEADLALVESLGFTKIRTFLQIESVMAYDAGFTWNVTAKANLNDFFDRCENHGISVIAVMNSGNHDGECASLDGKFRWDLPKTQGGIDVMVAAQTLYINELKTRDILMFEFCNEPYCELTWSAGAISAGTTKAQMHTYLVQSYNNAKLLTDIPVGFSELEEEEQEIYQTFSSASNRANYVDDCTDIYSMHIYRPDSSYVYDFSSVVGKTKWCSEFGHLNYNDPSASEHPAAGNLELYKEASNFDAVMSISPKLINDGFGLIMPWSVADNNGFIKHNADGSHGVCRLANEISGKIKSVRISTTSRMAATRTAV